MFHFYNRMNGGALDRNAVTGNTVGRVGLGREWGKFDFRHVVFEYY